MRKIALIFLFANLYIGSVVACSCLPKLSFCETAKTYGIAILEVEVTREYFDTGLSSGRLTDLKVHNILDSDNNENYTNLTAEQYGQAWCDYPLQHEAEVGDRLFVAITRTQSKPVFTNPVVSFSDCSTFVLHKEDGMVSGFITGNDKNVIERIPENRFRRKIKDLCNGYSLEDDFIIIKDRPATGAFGILNDGFLELDFELFNSSGTLIQKGSILPKEERDVNKSTFPPAVYFIRFHSGRDYFTRKVALF